MVHYVNSGESSAWRSTVHRCRYHRRCYRHAAEQLRRGPFCAAETRGANIVRRSVRARVPEIGSARAELMRHNGDRSTAVTSTDFVIKFFTQVRPLRTAPTLLTIHRPRALPVQHPIPAVSKSRRVKEKAVVHTTGGLTNTRASGHLRNFAAQRIGSQTTDRVLPRSVIRPVQILFRQTHSNYFDYFCPQGRFRNFEDGRRTLLVIVGPYGTLYVSVSLSVVIRSRISIASFFPENKLVVAGV